MSNENETIFIPKSSNSDFATANVPIPDEGIQVLYFYDVLPGNQMISEVAAISTTTNIHVFPSTTTSSTILNIIFYMHNYPDLLL